jgi:hypothetical protein
MSRTTTIITAGASSIALLASAAFAAPVTYTADLQPLNDTGATGFATLTYDDETEELRVQVSASGLDDGGHAMHIHGLFDEGADGDPVDSTAPFPQSDFDDDDNGILTVAEGADAYGPIILPLEEEGGGFQSGTSVDYDRTFDFSVDDTEALFAEIGDTGDSYEVEDLLPLLFRVIVIHGVDTDGGFDPLLPALAGAIDIQGEVPVPGAVLLFGSALAGFGAMRRKKA